MIKNNDNPTLRSMEDDDIFNSCTKLFLVGDDQFVGNIASTLKFPKFIDRQKCFSQVVGSIKVVFETEDNGIFKYQDMPIVASITFYKNMVTEEIVAISHQQSMVSHYDIYRSGILKYLPKIAENTRENLESDASTEFGFRHWCIETDKNHKENNIQL